jgi:hypothetical protein
MRFSNGRTYTAVVSAKSVYHAAALFREQCNDAPPELKRPQVESDTILEVKPIYPVRSGDALAWVAKQNSREARKHRQQR